MAMRRRCHSRTVSVAPDTRSDAEVMLARAIELKTELIHYATSGRFGRELAPVLDRFYADSPPVDDATAFLPFDYFAHQHRFAAGDTVIDRFVAERPDLTPADRELLFSWKD